MSSYSNNIVIDGLGGNLLATEGLGEASLFAPDPTTGPGAVITDVVARNKALFVTQFRQLREL